jgi:hypothetical protein
MDERSMTKELPYQRSDEFDQELYLRPISDNGRRFLRIMFQAANGTPADGCEGGIVHRTRFWLMAEQIVLADLMGISRDNKPDSRTKAVRRVVEELEGLGILKRCFMVDRNDDGKPIERLYYVLCLIRFMDLPEIDLNTPAGRVVAHLLSHDPFDDESTTNLPLSGRVSGGLSGPLSGGLSGPSKNPAPVPVLNNNPIFTPVPDQEQEHDAGAMEDFDSVFGQEKIPERSFAEIDPDEVRWIAGFSPQGKTPTPEIRRRMFLGYFRDAVANGFARVSEAELMLQVFSMAGHRMSAPSSPTVDRVRDPTDWIRTVWMNRGNRQPKTTPKDRRVVSELMAMKAEPAPV